MTRSLTLVALTLLLLAGASRALDAEATDAADETARRLVRDRVERQLAALEQSILAHEASQPRRSLLRRRFTVETFLMAALVPQAIAFAPQPDLAPLWRQDFRGEPRALAGPRGWPGRTALLGGPPADAVAGRFVIELLEPVDGDDAAAIGGRFVVGPDSATLAATWCEPCLHAESVDFPIVPEAFLLDWNRSHRAVATLLPAPRSHRELVRDEPPRLDQPEDLYDLFDGLRALPRERGDLGGLPLDRSGRDDREPRGPSLHVSHGVDGTELQRVRVEHDDASGELLVSIDQPPVRCRWSSPRRYEIEGDVGGDSMPIRSFVPQGEIESLTAPITATFRIRAGSIAGTIRRGELLLATLRWESIACLSHTDAQPEADRLREPFREALAQPIDAVAPEPALDSMPLRDPLDRLDAIDPIGADLRSARRNLLAAAVDRDPDGIERAFARHRRAITEQSLDPSTLWRGVEAYAEALASVEAVEDLGRWLDGPGSAAIASTASESLALMLADRLRMGRFGAAMLLASALDGRADADRPTRTWANRTLERLIESFRDAHRRAAGHDEPPAPSWWEPPGRSRLASLLAERFAERRTDEPSPATPTSRLTSRAEPSTPHSIEDASR